MAESSNFFIGITIPYYASLLNNCYHYIIITLSLFYIASNKSQETLHLSFYQSIFTKPLPLFFHAPISWTSPEGEQYFVKYIADDDGFRILESNAVPAVGDVRADGNQGSFFSSEED